MVSVHTLTNRDAMQMKKECTRIYNPLKRQCVLFVNARPRCFGNQDTAHLREFVTFVSYLGLTENIRSRQLGNLFYTS